MAIFFVHSSVIQRHKENAINVLLEFTLTLSHDVMACDADYKTSLIRLIYSHNISVLNIPQTHSATEDQEI